MVLPDGIKVMDFGIARAKGNHLTQDNNVLGTAHYVSPSRPAAGPRPHLGYLLAGCRHGTVRHRPRTL